MRAFVGALSGVEHRDQDFFGLIESLYREGYTGSVILHCVDGVPKIVEFPSVQVRIRSRDLTTVESSRTLSPST